MGPSLSLGFPQLCTLLRGLSHLVSPKGLGFCQRGIPKQSIREDYSGHVLWKVRWWWAITAWANIFSSTKIHPRSCFYLDCFSDPVYNGIMQVAMLAELGMGWRKAQHEQGRNFLSWCHSLKNSSKLHLLKEFSMCHLSEWSWAL